MDPCRETPADVERLLAHQGFLSALARSLVGDEHEAFDLVQDAWVASLRGPRPRVRDPRRWLAAILRNRWRNRARREAERPRRERDAARSELVDGDEVDRELELRQRVVEAVRALPEAYETAIYLRYYEGLRVAEIARRIGVPVETARSRIERGLELLRAKLDRRFGSRASWAFAVGAWGRGPSPIPSLAPTAGLRAIWLVVGACGSAALVVALALLAREIGGARGDAPSIEPLEGGARLERPPASAAELAAAERSGAASAPGDAPNALAAAAPAAVAPPSTASAAPGPTHEIVRYRVLGRVVGIDGRPVAGARIYYREPRAVTDELGRFDFELEEEVFRDGETIRHAANPLVAVVEGRMPALVEKFGATLPEHADAPLQVEIALGGPALSISGVVFDADGLPARGWKVALRNPTRGLVLDGEQKSLESLAGGGPALHDCGGAGEFALHGLFDRGYDLIAWHPATLRHALLEDVPAGSEGVRLAPATDALPRRIAGRLRSMDGRALAGARVRSTLLATNAWKGRGSELWVVGPACETDVDGAFELEGTSGQPLRLRVEHPGALVADESFDLLAESDDWGALELVVPLRCALVLEGHGRPAPAELFALLDDAGEKLWIELSEADAAALNGHRRWRGIPLEGRSSIAVHCNEAARTLLFYDWDGAEISRRPIQLHPDAPTGVAW